MSAHEHGSGNNNVTTQAPGSTGRRLFGRPTLWQDWHEITDERSEEAKEEVEAAVGYWELFTDLIMVAAASKSSKPADESFISSVLAIMIASQVCSANAGINRQDLRCA